KTTIDKLVLARDDLIALGIGRRRSKEPRARLKNCACNMRQSNRAGFAPSPSARRLHPVTEDARCKPVPTPKICAAAPPFRAAPHNIEAEQALLGAILVNNKAHDRVSSFLEAHHFYDPLHQEIYQTLTKLIALGKQATPITLRTFFENAEPIDAT